MLRQVYTIMIPTLDFGATCLYSGDISSVLIDRDYTPLSGVVRRPVSHTD